MRQIQVTVPGRFKEEVEDILDEYTSDFSSNHVEKNDQRAVEFTATVESDEIDELSEELKSIKEIDHGDLSIRILQQESLIEKGQETRGSTSTLSQQEIYSKAQQFSSFTKPQWGLIALSSAIAAYGLVLDNVIMVIGAMMLAPILSPFVSGAISLTVGDRSLMLDSMKSGMEAVLIAVFVSFIAIIPMNVAMNPTLDLVVSPGVPTVFLSFLVGAAAALTFATGLRDQIAGVAVAIALVPPLAAVGIGLNMADIYMALQAASVAFINLLAVIVAGFLSFRVLGLKPSTYYKQKEAERIRFLVPAALIILVLVAAPVSYLSYKNLESASVTQEVKSEARAFFGGDMIDIKFYDSSARIYVVGDHNISKFQERVPEGFEVDVIELQSVG
ncbi:MAG: TIGR00341 family protein [Candidatus Nanohaloarchaea archaeon]